MVSEEGAFARSQQGREREEKTEELPAILTGTMLQDPPACPALDGQNGVEIE